MTNFGTSLSAFVPAVQKDRVNAIMEAMGFGPGNFTVGLSPTGLPAPTKYGLHAADDGRMEALLDGTTSLAGLDFTQLGMTAGEATAAIATVGLRALPKDDKWGRENFNDGATAEGVKTGPG